jgi:nucleoside-diphosphate-sugar epimerase
MATVNLHQFEIEYDDIKGNKMRNKVVIVGASGLVGGNLSNFLRTHDEWQTLGVTHSSPSNTDENLNLDLREDSSVDLLAQRCGDATHLFFCSWMKQDSEAENARVNGTMLRNALRGFLVSDAAKRITLVTGTKHYVGPFGAMEAANAHTPFREDQPRLNADNFYYDLEDILFEEAEKRGISWSVIRPHTIIGFAIGNLMNMGSTIAAYASICRETGRPFVFPGVPEQYHGVVDITDARLLAKHLVWQCDNEATSGKAMNVVNGDFFRWKYMWPKIAAAFDLPAAEYPGKATPLQDQMKDASDVWEHLAKKHNLSEYNIDRVASWWHTDFDLGRDFEAFNDMTVSRTLGFDEYQQSEQSFLDLFEQLRSEKIIPS